MKSLITALFILVYGIQVRAERHISADSLKKQDQILRIGSAGVAVTYASSMSILYQTWYKPYDSGKFHFFNDLEEWKGMDKFGHIQTSWFVAQWLQQLQNEAGLNKKQSSWRSVLIPFAYMSTIEVFDGFSSGWGFSWSDMAANSLGLSLFAVQQRKWQTQHVLLKYSYQDSPEPTWRPSLLGQNKSEQLLKNYNGQTYWMSYPIARILPFSGKMPSYILLSLGTGISGAYGAESNLWMENGNTYDFRMLPRFRTWYLSFDIDLQKIPIRKRWWRIFSSSIRWIKIPAPVLSYSNYNGLKFSPFAW